jgi:hypothetical protein
MRSRRNARDTGPDQVQSGQVVRRRIEGPGIIYSRSCSPTGKSPTHLSSPSCKNISVHFRAKSLLHPFHPGLTGGAFRDRHGRWVRDAVDAACQARSSARTNDIARGRRSRVVLTPRRWRQVLEKQASCKLLGGDGGKQARSPGRARNKPLKPLRREGRVFR